MTCSLDAYTVKVHEVGSRQGLALGSFDGTTDVIEEIAFFLQSATIHLNNDRQRAIRQSKQMLCRERRTLKVVVEHGEYGIESNIFDTESDKVSYRRKRTEVDLKPFYFQMRLPADLPVGIAIFQRTGQQGIKTDVIDALSAWFQTNHPNHRIELTRLVPKQVIQELLMSQRTKRIRFIHHHIPYDKAEEYGMHGLAEEDGNLEVVFEAKRGSWLPIPASVRKKIDAFWDDQLNRINLLTIDNEGLGDAPDDIKVEIVSDGKSRTFSLANPVRLRPSLDISDRVNTGVDGHVTFESIDAIATEYMNSLASELWGGDDDSDEN